MAPSQIVDDACPYEAAFLSIQHSDLAADLTALGAALGSLAGLLRSTEHVEPEWLVDGGQLPCAFLQTQLLCRGSPQDYVRGLWARRRGKAAGLDAAFRAAAEALTGDQDPWALAEPAARAYRFPLAEADAGPVELKLRDGDYASSGPGRFVYGAAEALAHIVLGRLGGIDVRGQRVLELGCGVGLVGLACLAGGAAAVTLTDLDLGSLVACEDNLDANAEALGLERSRSRCLHLDWASPSAALPELSSHGAPPGGGGFAPFDLVVGADLCYSQDHAPLMLSALGALAESGCLAKGVEVLILNGWPNVGLRRFERLVGAAPGGAGGSIHIAAGGLHREAGPEGAATVAGGTAEAMVPHVRRFLPDEGALPDTGEGGPRMEAVDGQAFRCVAWREVVGGTDERGAPADFRVYHLRPHH